MIKNYFKIAIRNLWRHKTTTAINLFGLTIGTLCCIYILFFVQGHRQFDLHHVGSENIYRIISDLDLPNDANTMLMATCSPPIAPALKEDYPEVEAYTRVCPPPGVEHHLIKLDDKVFYENRGYYVDSTFFRIFSFNFLDGKAETALDEPFSVVISEGLSNKLFGSSTAVGEVIKIGGYGDESTFKITGVFSNEERPTHLETEFYMAMNSGGIGEFIRHNDSWAGNNFLYGYIRLKPGADPIALESKLPDFLLAHGADQFRSMGLKKELHLQPVTEIHTDTNRQGDMESNISGSFLSLLLLIAGFIQLVACINFMNLTTAKSVHRAQEVGVRKAIGAPRSTLILQFLGECLLISLLSMILALALTQAVMPILNNLSGTEVEIDLWNNWQNLGIIALVIAATGLLAGSYPAFYLSSFAPLSMLKGWGAADSRKTVSLRKSLVVGQFTIATVLVIGALIVRLQVNYMLDKDLGFDKYEKIVFPIQNGQASAKMNAFKNELLRLPEVLSASAMNETPGETLIQDFALYKPGENMNNALDIHLTYVDENFLETLKIDLLAGRNLTLSDTSLTGTDYRVIINETALAILDIPLEDAPGTILTSDFEDIQLKVTIVGVMEDVLYQNLHSTLDPFMVSINETGNLQNLVADIKPSDMSSFIREVENIWTTIVPDVPFEYTFLDQDMKKIYQSEMTLSRIIGTFTIIAILISCLGLFGLSIFAAEKRQREISIRKVLGAKVSGIVALLSLDFLKLVFISLLIAGPFSWYIMNRWLDNYAYHTDIPWWVFVLAGAFAILIAFFTISLQSIKAALVNPAETLRSE